MVRAFVALAAAFALTACGVRDKQDGGKRQASTCADGEMQVCDCPGGASGRQVCLEATHLFGDCDCTGGSFDAGGLDGSMPDVGVVPDVAIDSGSSDLGTPPDLARTDAGADMSTNTDMGTDSGTAGMDLGMDADMGTTCDSLLTVQGGDELATTTARSLTLMANVPAGTPVTWNGATFTANPLIATLDIPEVGGAVVFLNVGSPYNCVVRRSFYFVPAQGIAVALEWDTPTDADQLDSSGTDIDIHMLHPGGMWNNLPLDLFWNNPAPDWGVVGDMIDDPQLVQDDTNGAGPELVTLEMPEAGTYEVGIYYYADNGYGLSDAWIYVFVDGQLAMRLDAQLQTAQTFWHAVSVTWPGGSVTTVNQLTTGFP